MSDTRMCCGKERLTKFCPDCGKKIGPDHTLDSLIRHCESTAEGKRKVAAARRKDLERGEHVEYNTKQVLKEDATAAKWQAWADGIRELLKKEDPPSR